MPAAAYPEAMIRTFLRPPDGAADWIADGVRVLGAVSIVAALIGWTPIDAATFALVMLGLVLPRFLGARPALDIACGVTLLIAGWSAVLEIYLTVRWWDLPVHFALNGLVATVAFLLLVRLGGLPGPDSGIMPRWAVVVVTTALGLAAGTLWEIAEWAGHTFLDDTIYVGYDDTIGDLVVGAAGAVVAGLAAPYLMAHSRFVGDRVPAPA